MEKCHQLIKNYFDILLFRTLFWRFWFVIWNVWNWLFFIILYWLEKNIFWSYIFEIILLDLLIQFHLVWDRKLFEETLMKIYYFFVFCQKEKIWNKKRKKRNKCWWRVIFFSQFTKKEGSEKKRRERKIKLKEKRDEKRNKNF